MHNFVYIFCNWLNALHLSIVKGLQNSTCTIILFLLLVLLSQVTHWYMWEVFCRTENDRWSECRKGDSHISALEVTELSTVLLPFPMLAVRSICSSHFHFCLNFIFIFVRPISTELLAKNLFRKYDVVLFISQLLYHKHIPQTAKLTYWILYACRIAGAQDKIVWIGQPKLRNIVKSESLRPSQSLEIVGLMLLMIYYTIQWWKWTRKHDQVCTLYSAA